MTATPASIRAIWRPIGLLIIPDTRVDISCLGASTIRFVLRRRLDLPRWRTQPSWRAEQSLVWARSSLQVRAAIVSRSGRIVDDIAWAEIFKLSHGLTSDRNLLRLSSFGASRRRRGHAVEGGSSDAQGLYGPAVTSGDSGVNTAAPWHYAGDVLAVEFWNDPDASADILPGGVKLDALCWGRSVALFIDCQFTANSDEYLDPARYQCREFIVLLDATWQGSRIAWCPYAYADNDAAIMRGWIQGYPKKFGVVHQTRTFAATSAASAPLANKSRFAGCLSAHGQLLAEARVILRERADHLVGCSIGRLWRVDIFRGFVQADTTSRSWMNSFGA